MPAKHVIDTQEKLIVTTWSGVATDDDFIDGLKEYQKKILCDAEYYEFNELLDFRYITSIKLTPSGLRKIANIASLSDNKEVKTKLAFLVTSSLAYGLVRMYEVYRSFETRSTKTVRVFKIESEAYEWLRSDT